MSQDVLFWGIERRMNAHRSVIRVVPSLKDAEEWCAVANDWLKERGLYMRSPLHSLEKPAFDPDVVFFHGGVDYAPTPTPILMSSPPCVHCAACARAKRARGFDDGSDDGSDDGDKS